jgi:uncharacterized membrane protein
VSLAATLPQSTVVPAPGPRAESSASSVPRLVSIDVLRGLVMILMALDHSHFYFSSANSTPEYLPGSTPALFFTRWITHFCAPTFFFLAGASGFLSAALGGHSISEVSRFFWTRGLWLILLAFTVIAYASTGLVIAGYEDVIGCLGLSMVVMALLVWLPRWFVATFSVLVIVGHHVLDSIDPKSFGDWAVVWAIVHAPGSYSVGAHAAFFNLFTLIPWLAVMSAGYAYAPVLLRRDRRKVLWWSGAFLTSAFLVLRFFNLYGNGSISSPHHALASGPWTIQPSFAMTIVSFLNTVKYPASLQFLLMTLGPMLMALAWFDRLGLKHSWSQVLLVYGRVPLFFYILHRLLLRTMAIWVCWALHQDASWLQYGGPRLILAPGYYGYSLSFIYLMWVIAVALLYYPCKWFMELKRSHVSWWWLRYL